MTEHGAIILAAVRTYYEKDTRAESCDKALLINAITRTMNSPKHRDMFTQMVSEIAAEKVSPANIMSDYFSMKREDAAARLASALLSRREAEVAELLEEYERWKEPDTAEDNSDEEVITGMSVAQLIGERLDDRHLIKVLPRALNDRLDGGLLPGNHVVLYARPEMGKTMMLINMMAGFARQGLKVLYVGNEDPLADIIMRTICRLSDRTKAEVVSDPEGADDDARTRGYGNIIFAGMAPGTPREIEKLMRQFEPDVVMIDQLRNLGMKEENPVVKLEKAATAIRTLGKRYGLVMVSVTQAGDSASGKAILDMGDVDFSNTGIPATADVMIGLGASYDDEAAERRVISLPKNKRGGQHGFFPVMVDRLRNKVVSLE